MSSIAMRDWNDASCQLPDFLSLSEADRQGIYNTLGPRLGMTPDILEKDVWVCWTLDALFSISDGKKMAFKGGTSLSKAYQAISRFSEDVDVTVAHQSLDPSIDPFDPNLSRKARDRVTLSLNNALHDYVKNNVEPYFRTLLSDQFSGESWALDIAGDGEELRLTYPSVIDEREEVDPRYIRQYVKIEFGGRNATDPIDEHVIEPYILGHIGELSLPRAKAHVLSGARTFWEKATLAHVECNRPGVKANADRMSRHWYDLYKLADGPIGINALSRRDLLEDVVKYKKLFFNSSYAHYEDCLSGKMRLLPDNLGLKVLADDYEVMQDRAMLYDVIPTFDEIVERLGALEVQINS